MSIKNLMFNTQLLAVCKTAGCKHEDCQNSPHVTDCCHEDCGSNVQSGYVRLHSHYVTKYIFTKQNPCILSHTITHFLLCQCR